jgi:hypothetical protein
LFICVDTAYRPLLGTVSGLTLWSPLTSVFRRGTAAADTLAIKLVYLPMVDPSVLEAWQGARTSRTRQVPSTNPCARNTQGSACSGGSVIHPAVDLAVKAWGGALPCSAPISHFPATRPMPAGETEIWGRNSRGEALGA